MSEAVFDAVSEEARHLSFARQYLRSAAPELSRWQRAQISVVAPCILQVMAGTMMRPPGALVRRYDIPKRVLREAYRVDGPAGAEVRRSLRKVRTLLVDLGLVGPVGRFLWRRFRLWDDPAPA